MCHELSVAKINSVVSIQPGKVCKKTIITELNSMQNLSLENSHWELIEPHRYVPD